MNHQKIYESIIEKAKAKNRIKLEKNQEGYIYFENHHIIPKCLGGTDYKENRILLTAKEHFVCHKLLTYIYEGNRKIAYAFQRMSFSKRYGNVVSSRDYAYAIELYKLIPVSEESKIKMRKNCAAKRPEIRLKLSKASSGKNNGMYGKLGKNNPNYGSKRSLETCKNMSKTKKGEKNPMYGKHISTETSKKISNSLKGKRKGIDTWNKNKTYLNITPENINEIKEMYKQGKYLREIAEIYNFSITSISRIIRGLFDNKIL